MNTDHSFANAQEMRAVRESAFTNTMDVVCQRHPHYQALMRQLANLFPPSHPSGAPGGSGQQRGVDAVEAMEQVESAFAVSRALQVSAVHLK